MRRPFGILDVCVIEVCDEGACDLHDSRESEKAFAEHFDVLSFSNTEVKRVKYKLQNRWRKQD